MTSAALGLATSVAETLATGSAAAFSSTPLHDGSAPRHWQGEPVKPHHVFYVDNRVAPNLFHDMFARHLGDIRSGVAASDNPLANSRARTLVERALPQGTLRDSTRIRHALLAVNSFAGFGPKSGIRALEFQLVHANTQMNNFHHAVVRSNLIPAGLIFSGSPSMVNLAQDPLSVRVPEENACFTQTAQLMQFGLDREVPIQAICYGGQLLMYVRYGLRAVTRWMMVPPDMTHRVLDHTNPHIHLPVTPGTRHRNFGALPVDCVQPGHFLAKGAEQSVIAIKSHSQGLVFTDDASLAALGIPATDLIARSSRYFIGALGIAHTDSVVEVVQCGPQAVAIQFHPEVFTDLVLALTEIPDFGASLESEGYSVSGVVQPGLLTYPEEPTGQGGHIYSSNWFMYVLLPQYIYGLLRRHRSAQSRGRRPEDELTQAQIDHLERVLERLFAENPNMPRQ